MLPVLRSSLVGVLALLSVTATSAPPTIKEAIVSPAFNAQTIYTLSPRGMHLGSVIVKDGKYVVVVDGVSEEPFDQVLNAAIGFSSKTSQDGFNLRSSATWSGPISFSPDGTRHAYAGLRGNEVLVMLDGKEIFRGPFSPNKLPATNLHFSPDSKHLFFFSPSTESPNAFRLMRDGSAVTPATEGMVFPFFSADGSRWGVLASRPAKPNERFLIIDGKDAGYVGDAPQFTPDGKHVVSVSGARPSVSVLLNGKPVVTGVNIEKFVVSATGDIGSIVTVDRDGTKQLFLNGKKVAENAGDVVFSADGKHWAATAGLNQVAWIVVDGAKQREYSKVTPPAFSPDSTKCVYVGDRDGKRFVVVNGKEDAGNVLVHYQPIFSKTGNGVIYTAGDMMGKLRVYHNDHVEPVSYRLHKQAISPDGNRFVYYGAGDANYSQLIVDGVAKAAAADLGGTVYFSPDSKHVAGSINNAIWVDDQVIPFRGQLHGFSEDSRSVIHSADEAAPADVVRVFYVNGNPVAKFSTKGTQFAGPERPKAWEAQADGSIVFVGLTPHEQGIGPMTRITVTPAPDASIATWSSDLKAQQATAAAEALAAKTKAESDATAAAAKAKADADATAAKRKADYDTAVAAKQKAREDAAAAKAKARAEALAKARADAAAKARK